MIFKFLPNSDLVNSQMFCLQEQTIQQEELADDFEAVNRQNKTLVSRNEELEQNLVQSSGSAVEFKKLQKQAALERYKRVEKIIKEFHSLISCESELMQLIVQCTIAQFTRNLDFDVIGNQFILILARNSVAANFHQIEIM